MGFVRFGVAVSVCLGAVPQIAIELVDQSIVKTLCRRSVTMLRTEWEYIQSRREKSRRWCLLPPQSPPRIRAEGTLLMAHLN